MRLLIVDSESHLAGGVDTVRKYLVSALARHAQVETLVWLVPDHKRESYRRQLPADATVEMAGFSWPARSWQRWLHTLARRVGRLLERALPAGHGSAQRVARLTQRLGFWLDDGRVESLRRQHRSTHVLHVAVLTQPPPSNLRGAVGVIYDTKTTAFNGCDVLENFARWMRTLDKIVTISEFTRRQLIELAPERADHVDAILLGADPLPTRESTGEETSMGRSIAALDQAAHAVFYYPAGLNAHKDHLSLLRAAVTLARWGERFTIVLTGGRTDELLGHKPFENDLLEQARQFYRENLGLLEGRVQAMGSCPWEVVEEQYRSCHCVVLPTRHEGFGLPFVEALQRGAPIICSDIEPFMEQVEKYRCAEPAVRVFPTGDAPALAQQMRLFLRSQPESESDAARLRQNVSLWTWDHVAEAYVRALESAAS